MEVEGDVLFSGRIDLVSSGFVDDRDVVSVDPVTKDEEQDHDGEKSENRKKFSASGN